MFAPTIRLYFEDAYRTEFEALIVSRSAREGLPALALDRTCFYPESGGQPWDTGTINGVPVIKVLEEGEAIVHILEKDLDPVIQAGASITGRLDWPRRFDHMQQHSGQHILSQVFIEVLNGETKSFHLGAEFSTLEIGLAKVEEEGLEKVELRANDIVQQDKEIKTYSVTPEKISQVPFRRPPKKEGLIRVVEVEGFDYSACGGTHCRRTGEVGPIKITRWERIRGNVRFEFLCGGRAVADSIRKGRMVRQMAGQLSLQEKDLAEGLARIAQEGKSLHKRLKALQSKVVDYEARDMAGRAAGLIIKEIFKERTPEEARLLALSLIKQGSFVVLFGASGPERDHIILARSDDLAIDLREVGQAVAPLVGGRGGGGPSLVEIVMDQRGRLEAILDLAFKKIQERLG
ncbi:MAG TPA: alanyl-tRNA editing protein [Acidobacteriota bacterium]